tara:strand:+ start:1070 stop:1525 length:456 start_codon:yes stop_codon:yes gene_type:complete
MSKFTQIDGVVVKPLKQITGHNGPVLHMLRCDEILFNQFGEVYFSEVNPGAVKAWKQHKQQTQNLAVPMGNLRLVIYDDRPSSSTCGSISTYIVGRPENYDLIHIPPNLWYGFQNLGQQPSLIANCVDQPHDPSETETIPPDSNQIPYRWK